MRDLKNVPDAAYSAPIPKGWRGPGRSPLRSNQRFLSSPWLRLRGDGLLVKAVCALLQRPFAQDDCAAGDSTQCDETVTQDSCSHARAEPSTDIR